MTELSEKSLRTITGGNGYIYLLPVKHEFRYGTLAFIVLVEGDYPLYDISIDIIDSDLTQDLIDRISEKDEHGEIRYDPRELMNAVDNGNYHYELKNQAPGRGQFLPLKINLEYNNLKRRKFAINAYARNGKIHQIMYLSKVDSNWTYAYIIKKNEEEIARKIGEKFPTKDGKADFW